MGGGGPVKETKLRTRTKNREQEKMENQGQEGQCRIPRPFKSQSGVIKGVSQTSRGSDSHPLAAQAAPRCRT